MRRSRAFFLLSAALASVALAVACGTSNGDAGTRGLEDPDPETPNNPTPNRPAFEAGFPEDDGGKPVTPTGDGGPSSCNDPADPGSNAGGARALPKTDDNDENFKPVSGVLSSPADVDVYTLSAADVSFAELDTGFPVTTPGVELCVFVHCANAAGAVTPVTGCNAGTKQIETTSKWEGCCMTGPGDPTPKWDCDGMNDDTDFLLRVSPTPTTNACQAYSFSYRF